MIRESVWNVGRNYLEGKIDSVICKKKKPKRDCEIISDEAWEIQYIWNIFTTLYYTYYTNTICIICSITLIGF